jgi:formylglycine-generating enzyme required for sulfatase activity
LADLAVNDLDAGIRTAAVKALRLTPETDTGALERLGRAAANGDIRDAALFRAKTLLREIQFEHRMAQLQGADQLALAASVDGDPAVRCGAVARLSDQAALVALAEQAKDLGVRRLAAAKVENAATRAARGEQLAAVVPAIGQPYAVDLGPAVALALVWVPPTSTAGFTMGSPVDEPDRGDDETQHSVVLTRGFWLGRTPVTQAQWGVVLKKVPKKFKDDELPVDSVSWNDAMAFCEALTEQEEKSGRLPTGYEFTLPTEAQWEYACRAGSAGAYAGELEAMAWYGENAEGATHPVGSKKPNAWGLCDMAGNVTQWCKDFYGAYPEETATDPTGPSAGTAHVCRGGGWSANESRCRSAYRFNSDAAGLRVALVPRMKRN